MVFFNTQKKTGLKPVNRNRLQYLTISLAQLGNAVKYFFFVDVFPKF